MSIFCDLHLTTLVERIVYILEAENNFCITLAVLLKMMHHLFVWKANEQGFVIEIVD